LSDFQIDHEKIKEIKYLSPKIIQVINEKISNLINEGNRAYFNYALSIIHSINNIENSIIATTFLRKSISMEMNKKITINMIRSFHE
jgi:ubiquitin C-terminal hydrolase